MHGSLKNHSLTPTKTTGPQQKNSTDTSGAFVMMDTGFKTIIKIMAKGSWLTDLEVAERAKMKLDAALYYLRRLRRLGLVASEWVHGQRVWSVVN
jgi:ribosomal protein S25